MQVENGRTEQSMRGAEMADTPYRCRPFPASLYSRYTLCFVPVLLAFKKLSRHIQTGDPLVVRDDLHL